MWPEEPTSTILSCRIKDFKIVVFNSTLLAFFARMHRIIIKDIEPPGNKVGYDFQNNSYIKDLLVLNEEKGT